MAVTVKCPGCQTAYGIRSETVGTRVKCSRCGMTFTIASSGGETVSGKPALAEPPMGRSRAVSQRPSLASPSPAGSLSGQAAQQIAHYVVWRKLGEGAMGEVFLAHDPTLDREVAIKVLPPEFAKDPDRLERFLREARAAAKLDHPNTVTVYQAGVDAGRAFIVMQFVDGGSLDEALESRGTLPWREATQVIRDAAAGLAAAHEIGLVHRDVKPANLMRTSKGQTKVADFGLARAMTSDVRTTQAGSIMGTPAYMSPEQWKGQEADARSDLYGLICCYYHLLTGRLPFQAPQSASLGYQHRYEPFPDARQHVPDLPDQIVQILARGAQKQPEKRYQSAAELLAELNALLETPDDLLVLQSLQEGIARAPATPHHRRTRTQGPGGLASILKHAVKSVVANAGIATGPKERRQGPPRFLWTALGAATFIVLAAVIVHVVTNHGTVKIELMPSDAKVTVKVDGNQIEVSGLGKPLQLSVGEHGLQVTSDGFQTVTKSFTVRRGGHETLRVTLEPNLEIGSRGTSDRNSGASGPAIAPGGASGTAAGSTDEGLILNIGHWSRISDQAVSPDGKFAATITCREAIVWDLRTSKPIRKVAWRPITSGIAHVAFTPDGRSLLTGHPSNVILWDIAGGRERKRFWGHSDKYLWSIAISADGTKIATAGNDGLAILWDADTGKQIRQFHGHSSWISAVRFIPDGKRLVTGEKKTKLVVTWDIATGRQLRQFPVETRISYAGVSSLAVSPDGRQLAVGTGDRDVLILDIESGTQVHRFPGSGGGSSLCPVAFSRDGTRVVRQWDGTEVWDARTGKRVASFGACGALTASGDRVFLAGRPPRLCEVETGREIQRFIAPSVITSASFSPDDRVFAVAVWYDDKHSLVLWSLEQGRPIKTIHGKGGRVEFSRQGKRLLSHTGQTATIWNMSASLEEIGSIDNANDATFSPDGQRVLVGTSKAAFLWDIATRSKTVNYPMDSAREVTALAFDATGKYVVAGHYGRQFVVFDMQSGRAVRSREFKDRGGSWCSSYTARFDSTGKAIVIACGCEQLFQWDFGKDTVRELTGHNASVRSVELSPDGKFLLSGSSGFSSLEDQAIVWDASTGGRLATLGGHDNGIGDVAFSSDSRRVATVNGPLRVFDRTTGQEIVRLIHVGGFEDWIVITPDGRFDATPAARGLVGIRRGEQVFLDADSKARHFVPGLLARVWRSGSSRLPAAPRPATNVSPTADAVKPAKSK